jgi:hypothetical protein
MTEKSQTAAAVLGLLLVLVLPAQEPERSPQLQVLERFLGSWESLGADGKRFEVTRQWLGEGNFMLEEAIDENNLESYLALWTYDPQADRYRIVTLHRDHAGYLQGTWDAESASLHLDRITDQGQHSRLAVKLEGPDQLRVAGATQRRAEFAEDKLIRRRSEALRVLQAFVGKWSSNISRADTEEKHLDSSHCIWSRARKGDFLVSEGEHKASLMTYDPEKHLYRSVDLEAGGASFSHGRWDPEQNQMTSRFFAFELPRDATGKPLPDARYADGLNGDIEDRVFHKFMRQVRMRARIGSVEVWQGRGQIGRNIDPQRGWQATLASHPGKALIPGGKFAHRHGFGENLALGGAPRALKLFFDNRSIRKLQQPGLWLNVNMNRFEAGETVIFWRLHRVQDQPHLWQANADKTISPLKAPRLVLGWVQGKLRLVPKESDSRLVFQEVKS